MVVSTAAAGSGLAAAGVVAAGDCTAARLGPALPHAAVTPTAATRATVAHRRVLLMAQFSGMPVNAWLNPASRPLNAGMTSGRRPPFCHLRQNLNIAFQDVPNQEDQIE
jgi:hypothetical protein